MPFDPNYKHIVSSEEYYESMVEYNDDFDFDDDINFDEDCPDWVMEQIDEELPF